MNKNAATEFRLQLVRAREDALKDSEAFEGILYAVERLGQFLLGKIENLGVYEATLKDLAKKSPLATEIPREWRNLHIPFPDLYTLVRNARNDALHSGARARAVTDHAIQLSLILEDALRLTADDNRVSDFMVRSPVIAELWQPVSFARQIMLTNSFSYLPLRTVDGEWKMLSDQALAIYLQSSTSNADRKRRLATPLEDAELGVLPSADRLIDIDSIASVLEKLDGLPCLIFREDDDENPIGILTAFDVL